MLQNHHVEDRSQGSKSCFLSKDSGTRPPPSHDYNKKRKKNSPARLAGPGWLKLYEYKKELEIMILLQFAIQPLNHQHAALFTRKRRYFYKNVHYISKSVVCA
jgi:hypothetical protein